ncbi:hypothetical protein [Dyadobacter luticola]|uniref:Uncharacterized protein n=1 Tax=Dyadobacter luticola TaxID=1979387 RepID=A0A5R9L293_9BACT|nr:hypothetical protein [Dyadobacter luticola]TLV02704.1 hypothetical protein FEN17_03535 [Dyadobacter luticola]
MKSEEKLNEALRAALKRKFDDFEETPNPASFNIIRAHIKQPRNYKFLFLSLLLIGLVGTGLFFNQYLGENAGPQVAGRKDHISLTKSELKARVAPEVVTLKNEEKTKPEISRRDADLNIPRQTFKNRNKHQDVQSKLLAQAIESNLPAQVLRSNRKENLFQEADHNLSPQILIAENNAEEIRQPAPATTLAIQVSKLESEQMKSTAMNLPGVAVPEKDSPYYKQKNPSKVSWLVNAAVLKSYQILTVPKSSGQDFQNFKFPSVFSLESVGYKFSVGLEKKGFQALLHYSTFRLKFSYEIAGNEYIVQNEGQSYTIVRPGTVVTENNKMDLLGIGLSKQVLWGNSPFRKYYASAGLEYSRAIQSKSHIGWINASIGRQFAVNRNVLIHVGPYAEFSPLKMSGANNPFLYQPYRVGISLGMKLIRP